MELKISSIILATFAVRGANGFVPRSIVRSSAPVASRTARQFGIDPSVFHDMSQNLHDAVVFPSLTLSDAADAVDAIADAANAVTQPFADAAADAVSSAPAATAPAAADAASAVGDAAANNNGWFGFLTVPIEGLLELIHSFAGSWGVTIIAVTILIKALTFPLTKTQLESTNKMQAIQPQVKELQAKYESNPEVMNQKVAELYQANDVNPLAGCLPSLVQIPVFIGLYRAVLALAKEDKLNEPFLFLPNLEGPTYGADPAHGSDWILQGWTDAGPSLGWDDTLAFLALPVLLVISQFVSMQLMQPKDPAQQQNNVVLKILPVMIGWFSLNVPAALCIYWFVNNIVTTLTTVVIRNSMSMEPAVAGGGAASSTTADAATIFAPPPKKPEGFAAAPRPVDPSGVKPITSAPPPPKAEVIEAQIVQDAADDDISDSEEGDVDVDAGMKADQQPKKKRGKKRKGKKRKN